MLKQAHKVAAYLITLIVILSLPASLFAQGQDLTATALTPGSVVHADKAGASELVSIIVKLEDASLVAYSGGVSGLSPTNPRVAGTGRLDVNSPASQAYLAYLNGKHDAFIAAAQQAVPSAQVVHRLTVVVGGVSLIVPQNQVGVIAKLPGVKAVYRDALLQPDTERSPFFIGAPRTWSELGGAQNAGEGVVVGVLDTGIWPEHPSYSDPDPSGEAYAPPPATWTGTACEFGSAVPGDDPFTCNNKLIGAQRFMDTYDLFIGLLPTEFPSARDDNGHGTHTSSTAAGNFGVAASIFGVPRGNVSGIAPRAHVAMYKVCGDLGCFQSDSAAAVGQAIADGVDTLNFSISGGTLPYTDIVSLAFLDAYDAGVFVAASAGNSGPTANTVNHLEPWVTTVGASTTNRHFLSTVSLTADNGDSLSVIGASVTDGISTPTDVVYAGDFGDALCEDSTADGAFAGKVVICDRGVIARVEKSYNVSQRGGVGMLLRNLVLQGLATDNHFIPSVHLEVDAGDAVFDFFSTHTGVQASFTAGSASQVQGDVMAAFSSRGGPGISLGVNKPDVTAPGVQILAGHTPLPATITGGLPGELFQAIQGTSMSSPHVAGAGALLRDLHPDWTPGQIRSALMTSAKTAGVTKEDGVTPADAFDYGAGRIDLRVAHNPGLTFDATGQDYLDHQNDLWNVNYPSVYVPGLPGQVTVQRTAHSELSTNTTWRVSVSAPSDLAVRVPKTLSVPAGGDASFDITIDARDVPIGEARHATVNLRSGRLKVHIPITIVRGEASVTIDKSCDPASLAVGATTSCSITVENTGLTDSNVTISDTLPAQLDLVNSSVVGGTESGNRVNFSGTLDAAGLPVVTVIDGTGTTFGYLPLSLFGITPIAGVGDETLVSFTGLLPFVYAGVTYDAIGMVSNGYAVVGGGDSEDIDFINQILPDPARPNNVLAPFWTDLNPGAGGALRAAYLTDGVTNWLVLDWENVPNFSDGELNSFQLWIGSDGVTEDIFFNYGPVSDGDFGFLTVGAEDSTGLSGDNFYADGVGTLVVEGSEVRVTSVPGTPGEIHTISFDATGVSAGAWNNCAEMTGDTFFGIAIDCFAGEVTSP